ncbi:hypothetical protein E2562_005597 [Oryza meyeriana var. granulata]|uniref:Uncharacterized protein n=1 Tax=Oryza meyeriana var. granulata TaxID=110450 RepID=A0A6G1F466_9ORYZ|nr:hypothetical protein E2562_005597 [Oryza meyeriana var. granulata]
MPVLGLHPHVRLSWPREALADVGCHAGDEAHPNAYTFAPILVGTVYSDSESSSPKHRPYSPPAAPSTWGASPKVALPTKELGPDGGGEEGGAAWAEQAPVGQSN